MPSPTSRQATRPVPVAQMLDENGQAREHPYDHFEFVAPHAVRVQPVVLLQAARNRDRKLETARGRRQHSHRDILAPSVFRRFLLPTEIALEIGPAQEKKECSRRGS